MSSVGIDLDIDLGSIDEEAPPPADDEFCHISMSSGITYCGKRLSGVGVTCKLYEGEAICPTCGKVTCPDCAVRSSLNERLQDWA